MTKQNRIGLIVSAAVLGTVVASSAMAAPQQYCQNYAGACGRAVDRDAGPEPGMFGLPLTQLV